MIIDVHWHYIPEEFVETIRVEGNPWGTRAVRDAEGVEWLSARGFGHPLVAELYQPEAQIRAMDRRGVDLAAVSPSPTLFYYHLPAAQVAPLHRMVNDRIAGLVAAYPGRYAGLANVPLQAPALAIAEMERAIGELGFKGVEIGSNINGKNLDEPEFRPFFRRAMELGAFVFIHPSQVLGAERLARYYLTNLIGNPSDTGVAIASLIFGGVYDELPELTCCFAHGGGTFPLLLGRWQHGYRVRPEPRAQGARLPREYLSRIYVDTLTHDDAVRRLALDTVGADHMLLASDLPFDMGDPDPVGTVRRTPGLTAAEQQLILGDTAQRLLRLHDER